jgi:hypothetical protein
LAFAVWVGTGCSYSALDGLSDGVPDAAPLADASIADVRESSPGKVDAPLEREHDAPPDTVDADSRCEGGCPGNGYCNGAECVYPSCIARLLSAPKTASGVYWVDPDGQGGAPAFRAFCEMVLDGGGWTLVLKIDGHENTFVHDDALWENAETFHSDSADLDDTEAKLAGFATMPFGYLRVGMLENGSVHWLILPVEADSLASLMQGDYEATNVGRSAWERLPARGSLQFNCNREGINVETPEASVRIGIVANNQSDCSTCNSFIGFGGKGNTIGELSCGNVAATSADNGDRMNALFGYVMVR